MKAEKVRRIGWVGFVDGRAEFENERDGYCEGEMVISAARIFRNRKEARKRFQDVREVFVREEASDDQK